MINKIYSIINTELDKYLNNGVLQEHLLNFLNTDKQNFDILYQKIYRKLTLENISFESNQLTDCLKDIIQDRIAVYNDLKSSN